MEMNMEKRFPEGMEPLEDRSFRFKCHPGVACFTVCCKNVDLDLYPYDIVRLKNKLNLHSERFMREYTELKSGANPFFPTVSLKLKNTADGQQCPFLESTGCSVYRDRPTACRTYPLERAVDRQSTSGRAADFYFLTNHDYCLGHQENHHFTVKNWLRNQQLADYNVMNDWWATVDTLFATNPWKGEGAGGEKQQLAFFVCYNIDGFRSFSQEHRLLKQFRISNDLKNRIRKKDSELLKFGFEWIKQVLGGTSSLVASS